jgi:hypothetical protein
MSIGFKIPLNGYAEQQASYLISRCLLLSGVLNCFNWGNICNFIQNVCLHFALVIFTFAQAKESRPYAQLSTATCVGMENTDTFSYIFSNGNG